MMKSLLCLFTILTYTSGVIQSNFAHEDNSNGVCTVCTNNVEYCDPTWLPEPNLNYALRGIDITMKRPALNQSAIFGFFSRNLSKYVTDGAGPIENFLKKWLAGQGLELGPPG